MGAEGIDFERIYDFIIVGAGYAGLVAALTLAENGQNVVLVDANAIGGNKLACPGVNQSSISGGHVTYGYSQDYDCLIQDYGEDYARSLFQLSLDGVSLVERLCQMHDINDAAFHRGYITISRNSYDDQLLQRLMDVSLKMGVPVGAEKILSPTELQQYINSPEFLRGAMYSTLSGQLEPRAYVLGLAQALRKKNVHIIEHTTIQRFVIETNKAVAISSHGERFQARRIIVSGGVGILRGGQFPMMRQFQAVVGNAAIRTEPLDDHVVAEIFPLGYQGAFSDLRRSDVLYARLTDDNCLDFGAYSFAGCKPNVHQVKALLYKTFPQLSAHNIEIASERYGFLAGSRQEIVQIFQQQKDGTAMPVNHVDVLSPLTVLSAFAAEGINLGSMTGYSIAQAFLGNSQNINILARITHPKLPFMFPWERANALRDYIFAGSLSAIDRYSSSHHIGGAIARRIAEWI